MMNNNKKLKPNLLDPVIPKKIIKTLNPPKEDYWEPTKNIFQSFYQNYIQPNICLVIVIALIIILLIYRYRSTRKDKEEGAGPGRAEYIIQDPRGALWGAPTGPGAIQQNTPATIVSADKSPTSEYARTFMDTYNLQKEQAREPKIKKFNERVGPAPRLAYPMYPYVKGGSLAPSAKR